MQDQCESGSDGGRRRVRMMRAAGQSLVLSRLCGDCRADAPDDIEIRVSQVCDGGAATLEVLIPDNVFVERKEIWDGVRALFESDEPQPPHGLSCRGQ